MFGAVETELKTKNEKQKCKTKIIQKEYFVKLQAPFEFITDLLKSNVLGLSVCLCGFLSDFS